MAGQDFEKLNRLLQKLIHANDENMFKMTLKTFRKECGIRSPTFLTYFMQRYLNEIGSNPGHSPKDWAFYFRREMGYRECTTNNFIESFHSIFKRKYLKRVVNKRLDDLLQLVRQHELDQNRSIRQSFIRGKLMRNDHRTKSINLARAVLRNEIQLNFPLLEENIGQGQTANFEIHSKSDKSSKYVVVYQKLCQCDITTDTYCNHALTCNCPGYLHSKQPCKHCAAVWPITSKIG